MWVVFRKNDLAAGKLPTIFFVGWDCTKGEIEEKSDSIVSKDKTLLRCELPDRVSYSKRSYTIGVITILGQSAERILSFLPLRRRYDQSIL